MYIKPTWTFTGAACVALEKEGVFLVSLDTSKGFYIDDALLERAKVIYVRGNPGREGLLRLGNS